MTTRRTGPWMGVLTATVFWTVAAGGRAEQPVVAGRGMVQVQQQPTMLRMSLVLMAKGKTLEGALAKLKDRRQTVAKQMEALGADKDSISFGTPAVSHVQSAQQQRLLAIMAQRAAREEGRQDADAAGRRHGHVDGAMAAGGGR